MLLPWPLRSRKQFSEGSNTSHKDSASLVSLTASDRTRRKANGFMSAPILLFRTAQAALRSPVYWFVPYAPLYGICVALSVLVSRIRAALRALPRPQGQIWLSPIHYRTATPRRPRRIREADADQTTIAHPSEVAGPA